MTPPRIPSRRGFTLIELLTVIAIIGILAAILIPTVGRVRDSARASQQASNMRQMGMGLALYLQENKQILPRRTNNRFVRPDGAENFSASWMELLNDYLVPRGARNSTFLHRENPIWRSPFAENFGTFSQHFGVNVFIVDGSPSPSSSNPFPAPHSTRRMSSVTTPSRSVYVGEVNSSAYSFDPRTAPMTERDQETSFRATLPGTKTMLLFLDFHVETKSAAEAAYDVAPERYNWFN